MHWHLPTVTARCVRHIMVASERYSILGSKRGLVSKQNPTSLRSNVKGAAPGRGLRVTGPGPPEGEPLKVRAQVEPDARRARGPAARAAGRRLGSSCQCPPPHAPGPAHRPRRLWHSAPDQAGFVTRPATPSLQPYGPLATGTQWQSRRPLGPSRLSASAGSDDSWPGIDALDAAGLSPIVRPSLAC